MLNVLAFVLIGLQLRPIFDSLKPVEREHYLKIAAAVLGMVVAVRLGWVMLYNRAADWKYRLFGAGVWPGSVIPDSRVVWWWAGPACAAS